VAAQNNLAIAYTTGAGVERDPREAIRWWQTAADAGDAMAAANLAAMYVAGNGVQPDPSRAVYWWREAAQQGLARAQAELGSALVVGRGSPTDVTEGYMWLVLAAERATEDEREEFTNKRDAARTRLTPREIEDAERRANAWTISFEQEQDRSR
jgi:TPR repeat protein